MAILNNNNIQRLTCRGQTRSLNQRHGLFINNQAIHYISVQTSGCDL